MTTETIAAEAVGTSIKALIEYGVLGVFGAIGVGFMFYVALSCAKSTKTVVDNNTKAINDQKDATTAALNNVALVLAEIKGKIQS